MSWTPSHTIASLDLASARRRHVVTGRPLCEALSREAWLAAVGGEGVDGV
jgi:hypothetical protein